MLSAEDIQDLVNGGEGYNVDFKRSVPSKVRELTEEILLFLDSLQECTLWSILVLVYQECTRQCWTQVCQNQYMKQMACLP